MDPVQQKEILAEGFDDDGEDGSGDKLLTVLQKMDIGNIMVVVCIWNNGVSIGEAKLRGGEFFRMITERARELLAIIKEGVLQGEIEAAGSASPRRAAATIDLLNMGSTSKSPTAQVVGQANSNGAISHEKIDEQILLLFKKALSDADLQAAQKEIDESIDALTKSAVLELRNTAKPHPLVEKTLNIVVALRGFKHVNWNTAKDMLAKPSFKIDLMQVTPKTLRPPDVLRA